MAIIDPCDFGNPIPCGVNPAYSYTRYPCDQDDPRPTIDTRGLPVIIDLQTPVKAEVVNRHREAILAIEGELGIQPSGTYTTVRDRLDAMQALLCGIWESVGGIRVLYNDVDVLEIPVREINFYGAGVTVSDDPISGRVNVYIPCCGGECIDGYIPQTQLLSITENGQTEFILDIAPYNDLVVLFIDGLKQDSSTYTVSGTSLTWLGTPLFTTDTVEVYYSFYNDSSYGNSYQPTIEELPVLSSGQTSFSLSTESNSSVILFISGLKQPTTNYSVVGTDITWTGSTILFPTDTVEAFYTITGGGGDIWEPISIQLPVTTIGQLSFTLPSTPWNGFVLLFIDGIKQTEYIVTENIVTWTGLDTLIPSDSVEFLYFNYAAGQCGGSSGGNETLAEVLTNGNVANMNIDMDYSKIINVAICTDGYDVANKYYVDNHISSGNETLAEVLTNGNVANMNIDMDNNKIINVAICTDGYDVANKYYVDNHISGGNETLAEVLTNGNVANMNIDMDNNKIINVAICTDGYDAANKYYVDSRELPQSVGTYALVGGSGMTEVHSYEVPTMSIGQSLIIGIRITAKNTNNSGIGFAETTIATLYDGYTLVLGDIDWSALLPYGWDISVASMSGGVGLAVSVMPSAIDGLVLIEIWHGSNITWDI
jgi:hypothetical protein